MIMTAEAYIKARAGRFFDRGTVLTNAVRCAQGHAQHVPERAAHFLACAERAQTRLNELRRQHGYPDSPAAAIAQPDPAEGRC